MSVVDNSFSSIPPSPCSDASLEESLDTNVTRVDESYSSQMGELFEDDNSESHVLHGSDDDEELFLYSGVDSNLETEYRAQLRDVLGRAHEDDRDDESDALEVEKSLIYENESSAVTLPFDSEEHPNIHSSFSHSRTSEIGLLYPDSRVSSPDSKASHFNVSRPFPHLTVSRLRSYTSQPLHFASNESLTSNLVEGLSSISSISQIQAIPTSKESKSRHLTPPYEAFKWTELQTITQTMFSKASQKASTLLGSPLLGLPTVLAANGLICIGTTEGKVVVYNFNQTVICVLESKASETSAGPVSSIALSHDHTFVASGHSSGFIQLYSLRQSRHPIRTVAPTTLAAVLSGRKEGHLHGSEIIGVGFVGDKHTALVSADGHGLAFFHSLGKILFVEAPDIRRILGRYPDHLPSLSTPLKDKVSSATTFSSTVAPGKIVPSNGKPRHTVLAMSPLPLGTLPHVTDSYRIVALLTPTKLVVIGLSPMPRTWFKCPRQGVWKKENREVGSLAWFPSVLSMASSLVNDVSLENQTSTQGIPTDPILAFSWGCSLHLIRVKEIQIKQSEMNPKTGKTSNFINGSITHEQFGIWLSDDDILALEWLNRFQIVIATRRSLGIYDINLHRLIEQAPFDSLSVLSPTSIQQDVKEKEKLLTYRRLRIYKGKLFLLKRDLIMVGTLLTWADRILSLVEAGDFLKAIELARSYYTDEAPGNRNGLPDNLTERKVVIGQKLRGLMVASAEYSFSEDRMTDGTHSSDDNRGVDRTSLFENLVTVCCKTSIALDDFEYLFEDLFQRYDESGITPIYLRQLEPFILGNEIHYVPPRITQRLIALHDRDGHPEYLERIIWHMDPSCLDLNQAIRLCHQHRLYDALIFIYTRAMKDFVSPVVELLGLIRKVQQFRTFRDENFRKTGTILEADALLESTIIDAYKIYPYLANVLSGLTYPSEEPLEGADSFRAKRELYNFLFFGPSSVCPPGDGGKLIVMSEDEGDVEPTYPYIRQLLMFDSESFLNSLDIAFEDNYLNDESQAINRLIIVRIILEIMSTGHLLQGDITMAHIFIARNVPKYPQFLQLAPSALHNILIGLAEDPDFKTREDRQLAAEYLLSVYNPHDSEQIIALFESSGFYRILRSWHYREQRWTKLLSSYIDDPDMNSLDLFGNIENVFSAAYRSNKSNIREELAIVISGSLSQLLRIDIAETVRLLNKLDLDLHSNALESFGNGVHIDHDRYEYLHVLLSMHFGNENLQENKPLSDNHLRHLFFDLQCQFHPEDVIPTLRNVTKDRLDLQEISQICEAHQVYNAVVWATNWKGDAQEALRKADKFQTQICQKLWDTISSYDQSLDYESDIQLLIAIADVSRAICIEHSQSSSEVPLENLWFLLLSSQIHNVQVLASPLPLIDDKMVDANMRHSEQLETILHSLRSLVQATFTALVSITTTSTISFPRLFKRLINATSSPSGSLYTEFQVIFTGMLASYRSDEDLLVVLKQLVDRDLSSIFADLVRERARGSAIFHLTCHYCCKAISSTTKDRHLSHPIIISQSGFVFHEYCRPSEIH